MKKKLSEMSLKELWKLFPIVLTEHNDEWIVWFADEKKELEKILTPYETEIHHIGSTAIQGIWAKPIIDILIEMQNEKQLQDAKNTLQQNGYLLMSKADNRISMNKGYTENGFAERVFHLHLRLKGDCDEIFFRDRLHSCPEIAKEYEALKLSLWKRYEHDRDGYTQAKTEFIQKHTKRP